MNSVSSYIQLAALFTPLMLSLEQAFGASIPGLQKQAIVISTALNAANDINNLASGPINPTTITQQGPQVINDLAAMFNGLGIFKKKAAPVPVPVSAPAPIQGNASLSFPPSPTPVAAKA